MSSETSPFHFREHPIPEHALVTLGLNDFSDGAGTADSPEEAATWIIEQLDDESMQLSGTHLHEFDLWILAHSVFEVPDHSRTDAGSAISRSVNLVRSRVERCNALAWPSGRTQPGLHVPWSIEYRYETIYQSEFPWVGLALQNAFMGNPLAGERTAWRSRKAMNLTADLFGSK